MNAAAPTTAAAWQPVRAAAMRGSVLSVFTLVLAGAAFVALHQQLRVAAALALSIGCGAALVAQLPDRPRLAALWAELTALIAVAFWIASLWNTAWTGVAPISGLDLGLGAALLVAAFALARTVRQAAAAIDRARPGR